MSYNKLKPATSDLSFDQAWGLLESAGWLAARDARKRRDLRTIARRRTCEPGDYLYHAGDTADGVYGLVRGTLDILIPRLDGEEQLVHRAEPGFWVGDLALYDMVALSPDERSAVVGIITPQAGTWDLWIVDLERNFRTRFTHDPGDDSDMV